MTGQRRTVAPTPAPVGHVHRPAYRVSVAGDLGPALRGALADLQPTRSPPSTLLRVRVPAGRSAADVAAMLQAQGLELVTLRLVPERLDSERLAPDQDP